MTIYGWDASSWDWERGPMDLAAARDDGISFFTHKCAEGAVGWYEDPYFPEAMRRARDAGIAVVGAYYVNHPGAQEPQVDWFIRLLERHCPWWREGPFLIQLDAERFDYMPREPSPAEIRIWCDRILEGTGRRPIVYAPRWLYGDRLIGLPYQLWQSHYGGNPAAPYRQAYPGDASERWAAYSGQTPVILQYGSECTIGRQSTCDANAFRGTLDELTTLVAAPC